MKYVLILSVGLAFSVCVGQEFKSTNTKPKVTLEIIDDSMVITNYISCYTNYMPFMEIGNIDKKYTYPGVIDYAHPTNVEMVSYHEPILITHTNGVWVYHFKN